MAPKKRLPRKTQTLIGQPNLEEAAAERIDAITAEPLHAKKYVEIMSPDGTLRLFYNTSTLIRIATDRGMFMQPPHFREPMTVSLQREVEDIEGRRFHFEKSNVILESNTDESAGGLHVLHRHVYFDQIMDEFYLLNPTELYVCPSCYLHWVSTRFLPHMDATRQRVDYIDDDPNPVLDPLDVLAHVQGSATAEVENNETNDNEGEEIERVPLTIPSANELPDWDSPLVHMVFRRAVDWRKHVRLHHNNTSTSAADYRLKAFLTEYISKYNRLSNEKQRRRGQSEGINITIGGPTLTVSRYWYVNARYNRLRYNRIVETVERAEPYIDDCVTRMAFNNEEVMNTFHSNDADSSESDFICDSESDDSSSSSNDDNGSQHNEGSPSSSEAEETEEVKRGRKRLRENTSSSNSNSSSSSSLEIMAGSDSDDSDSGGEGDASEQQRKLYKSGILAPHTGFYSDLSYEERCVINANSRRVFKPTSLYMPTVEEEESDDDEGQIDWSQFGGTIENATVYVRDMQQRQCASTAAQSNENRPKTSEANAPVSITAEISRTGDPKRSETAVSEVGRTERTASSNRQQQQQRLLLDDSD
ncbi:uncharacterized protein TM35_000541100 [Trypanosoma theileri]|uniref:Uncharacterized protein n=1 Tax=Trypanosoma theileri TaxID=67003 RepID=A0A1X0NGQ9_9TRYP|nr:uncharacterized protein TM35_000541100 [Trypanosoma theileri]ORC83886.1 hypothetical protein TM35_000541100 [Trypanosoma theileri]